MNAALYISGDYWKTIKVPVPSGGIPAHEIRVSWLPPLKAPLAGQSEERLSAYEMVFEFRKMVGPGGRHGAKYSLIQFGDCK